MPQLLAEPLVALGLLAACAFLIALSYAYNYSIGAFLQLLAHLFDKAVIRGPFGLKVGLGFIGDAIRSIDNNIRAMIGSGIQKTEYAWHRFLQWNANAFSGIGKVMGEYTHDVAVAWHTLRHATIPNLIHAVTRPITQLVHNTITNVSHVRKYVTTEVTHVTKVIRPTVTKTLPEIIKIVRVSAKAIAAAPGIATTIPRIALRDVAELRGYTAKQLRRIARTLTPAGIAGLLVAALGSLGLGWVRCSKVGRAGKALCGLNENLLQSILADALLIASTISIVELAKECQDFTATVEEPLKLFVRELKQVNPLKGGDYTAALRAYAAGDF